MSGFSFHLLADYKGTDPYPFWCGLNGASDVPANAFGKEPTYGPADGASTMRFPTNGGYGDVAFILPDPINCPTMPDMFDGTFADFPVYVGSNTANQRTIRGRVQDIRYIGGTQPAQIYSGVVDNLATPTVMTVGNYWYPCNAVPSL
jgi:hypothetical protein